MSDVVVVLRLEHDRAAKLLDIIEDQLRKLDRNDAVEYDLIASVVDYCRSYGGECHHPKEDLVYRMLQRRDRAAAEALGDLLQEHEDLARLTGRIAGLLEKARQEDRAADRELAAEARYFLEFYRRHMAKEETQFLPAAFQALSAQDWEEIDFKLFDREDPVYSSAAERRFGMLREYIIARAR